MVCFDILWGLCGILKLFMKINFTSEYEPQNPFWTWKAPTSVKKSSKNVLLNFRYIFYTSQKDLH